MLPGMPPASGGSRLLEIAPLSPERALNPLLAFEEGLSPEQAEERRQRYGPNEIGRVKKLGFFGEIIERARNPLVIQLLVIG